MQFSESQWKGLYEHTKEVGMEFASSPFSLEAVELLKHTGIDIWKIPSGELSFTPLLEAISQDGRPTMVSTGMATYAEIDSAIDILRRGVHDIALLQCTTSYPCPPEDVNLRLIPELKKRFDISVGLSDHSGTTFAGLAAACLGASVVEVHVTLSRSAFGPDVSSSITFEELQSMRDGFDFIQRAMGTETSKDDVASSLKSMRSLFTKSLVTRYPLSKGSTLRREDLTAKKPGTGIPFKDLDKVVGRRLSRDLPSNEILDHADLEET
jgi:N,N'-diacetyllegionaminate synthase